MTPTTLVIPTVGRPSLHALLRSLAAADGPHPIEVIVVDDRPGDPPPLEVEASLPVRLLRSGGSGPAGARNVGWRAATTPWVSFVDDDVLLDPDWLTLLADDLATDEDVVAVQGRVTVPLPTDRAPRDWERSTAGLEHAPWITADMSVRWAALERVGGFDERFTRAYREDSDLGLRLTELGAVTWGRRGIRHPVRPEDDWVSVRVQRGNADDQLMRALHGRHWRERVGAPRGRLRWHIVAVGAAATAVAAALAGRPRAAAAGVTLWAGFTARFALMRILPGPRDAAEVRRMAATSVVIPFAAVRWAATGRLRHRAVPAHSPVPALVLFDRDGTLVHDVPYNDDPALVKPVDGAAEALGRLRAAGVRIGIVSNQSGVARGLIAPERLDEVNARVEQLLGPFDVWQVCPHGADDGCACRKPAPGMVLDACAALDVAPERCVVVGDIGADVEAARRAGARSVLVPTPQTLSAEVDAAPRVAPTLPAAVDAILTGAR